MEERAKHRLYDIGPVHSPSDLLAQILFGQSSEPLGIFREDGFGGRLIAVAHSVEEVLTTGVGWLSQFDLAK